MLADKMITPDCCDALYKDFLYRANRSTKWFALLGSVLGILAALPSPAGAEALVAETNASDLRPAGKGVATEGGVGEDPEDPSNLLFGIKERLDQKDSLFRQSPLHGAHEFTDQ